MLLVSALGGWVETGAAQTGEKRLALVIGNANYKASTLPTSLNDAGLVAQTLAQAGFDITAMGDIDGETTRKLFRDFQAKLQSAGPETVAFVYIAGYGMQFDGENYLAPVDARIARDIDVPAEAVRLSELTQPLEATPARARIFVYDLARAVPFATSGAPLASGLVIPLPRTGTLSAFNAAPGTVAMPDTAPFGLYARSMAEMIQSPGLSADTLFQRVRLRVAQRTNGAVLPFESGTADVVFHSGDAGAPAVNAGGSTIGDALASSVQRDVLSGYVDFARTYPADPLTIRVRRIIAVRREALIWREALQANTARAYWTYMRRYPRGPHFGDVRRRLAALHEYLEPPPRFEIYDFAERPPAADEIAALGGNDYLLADPGLAPLPQIPEADLPPPRMAFFEALPPPPIVPRGVIPIPMPVAMPGGAAEHSPRFGRIVQPFVPGIGEVIAETSGPTMLLSSGGTPIARTVEAADPKTHAFVESTANGATISRTVRVIDKGTVAIVQRGPSGHVLTQAVTRPEPDGGTSTVVIDGQNRLIGDVRISRFGILESSTRGVVPAREQMFVLAPGAGPDGAPNVMSLAQLDAGDLGSPQLPASPAAPVPSPKEPAPLAQPAPKSTAPPAQSSTVPPPPATRAPDTIAPVVAPKPVFSKPIAPPPAAGSVATSPALKLEPPRPSASPTGGATLGIEPGVRQPAVPTAAVVPSVAEPPRNTAPALGTSAPPMSPSASAAPTASVPAPVAAPPVASKPDAATASVTPAAPTMAAPTVVTPPFVPSSVVPPLADHSPPPPSQANQTAPTTGMPQSTARPTNEVSRPVSPVTEPPRSPRSPPPAAASPKATSAPPATSPETTLPAMPEAPRPQPPGPAPGSPASRPQPDGTPTPESPSGAPPQPVAPVPPAPAPPPPAPAPKPLASPATLPSAKPMAPPTEPPPSAAAPTKPPLPPPRPDGAALSQPSGALPASQPPARPSAAPLPPRRPALERTPERRQPRESGARHKTVAPARRTRR